MSTGASSVTSPSARKSGSCHLARAVGRAGNAPVTGSYASVATLPWHMNDTRLTHPHRKRLL
jgi:hypothetical protein